MSFTEWYMDRFVSEEVTSWHGGKVVLYWVATALVSFVAMFLMLAINEGEIRTADLLWGWLLFTAGFGLAGPLPVTWMWLSARGEGDGADS